MDKQPTTLSEALEVCQDVSQNFGSRESYFEHSIPINVQLSPLNMVIIFNVFTYIFTSLFPYLLKYCTEGVQEAKEVAKDLTDKAIQIRLHLLNNIKVISFLLKSHAAINLIMKQLLKGE